MQGSTMDLSSVAWRKSSRSTNGGDCVEVAIVPGDPALAEHKADADELYLVRDSKDLEVPRWPSPNASGTPSSAA